MPSISKWTIDLQTNTASFKRGLKGARKSAKGFGGSIRNLIGGPMTRLLGILGVAGGAAGFGYLIKRQMATLDAIAKTSDAIGIQSEKLIGLQHGAALAGVGSEALTKGLIRMQRNVSDANDGLSTSVRAFKKLGLETKALARLSPDEQLEAIAEGMKLLPNATERTAVAMQIFGRAGADLIPLLQGGAEELRKSHEEAKRFGITLGRDVLNNVEQAGDAIRRLKVVSGGMAQTMTAELAPIIKITADFLRELMLSARNASGEMPNLFEGIVTGAVFAANAVQSVLVSFVQLRLLAIRATKFAAQNQAATGIAIAPNWVSRYAAGVKRGFDILFKKGKPKSTTDSFLDVFIDELEETRKQLEKQISGLESADWGDRIAKVLNDMRDKMAKAAKDAAAAAKNAFPDLPEMPKMPSRPGLGEQIVREFSHIVFAKPGEIGSRAGRKEDLSRTDARKITLLEQMRDYLEVLARDKGGVFEAISGFVG